MGAEHARTVEIIPSASALLQSLRGLGYAPETALADLIDNSIAAGAARIDVDLDWNGGTPVVAILDDGRGLDFDGLSAAMRFGGDGPMAERTSDDLGRFGLGLKTASLSQCRRMTVASRKDGLTSCLAWDVDQVAAKGKWEALVPEALPATRLAEAFGSRAQGTLVVWEHMDAIGGLFGLDSEDFFARLQNIRAHFAMVFHRFLAGDARRIAIAINGRVVRGWDPFQRNHPATITMPTERLRSTAGVMDVSPFVLPHRDRFANEAEYEAAGGFGGWSERQGFYVYRGKRLVAAGGWLGLGGARAWTREESSRLARLSVDLPTHVDAEWRIDVRKSLARPPAVLRPRLTAIAAACRGKAREVFAWRGGKVRRQAAKLGQPVWTAEQISGRVQYRINRNHPALQRLFAAAGDNQNLLTAALVLIEKTVPIERIWLDVSETGDTRSTALSDTEISLLADQLASVVTGMSGDDPVEVRLDRMLQQLPVKTGALRRSVLRIIGTPDE